MSTDAADTYDEDADFTLGFDNTTADPVIKTALDDTPSPAPAPADPPAPAPKADGGVDPRPQDEPPVDEFAGLPPAMRNLLADVPRLKAEVESLRRQAGQLPALQSKLDKLERSSAPPSEAAPAKKRFEKVEALRSQGLDDIAAAMEEIAAVLPSEAPAPKTNEPAPAAPVPAPAPDKDPVIEVLDKMRPSWGADLQSADFELWLTQQPDTVQKEVRGTNNPAVMLGHLAKFDTFKASTQKPPAPTPPQRQQRMANAITPRGDGRTAGRTASTLDDEDEGMQAGFYGGNR